MKKIISLIIVLVMVLSLSACGNSGTENMTTLVQGNLDEIYLGKFSEEYMKLVNSTQAECESSYLEGLETEASTFCYYFNVEYPTDALIEEIVEMYKAVYAHSKYTVKEASKLNDTTYVVQVEIFPIDIFTLVDENWDEGMAGFNEKYVNADIASMTEEEYIEYDHDWAHSIIDMVYDQLAYVDYMEPVSIAVQIVKGSDDIWMINQDDFYNIDSYVIYYP